MLLIFLAVLALLVVFVYISKRYDLKSFRNRFDSGHLKPFTSFNHSHLTGSCKFEEPWLDHAESAIH